MATLILDIETVGQEWDIIPESTQYALTKWIGQQPIADAEKDRLSAGVQEKLGLSPFTGQIASLAMYDVERRQGVVYLVTDEEMSDYQMGDWKYKIRSEKELLEDFWISARSYDVFVTFNGRAFDIPFLLHRSIIQTVRPTVELTGQRYLTRQTAPYHVDLLDEFSFYGALQRRPSLQLLCNAYHIAYEKPGVGGEDIGDLFQQGKFKDIAEKNAADVIATNALFEIWKQNLAPLSFVTSLEY